MHGSQGIMVDNHLNPRAEPEGEAWLSAIIPMATVHQLIYILPLIGQWLLSTETNRLHRNNVKQSDSDKKTIQLELSTESAHWGGQLLTVSSLAS